MKHYSIAIILIFIILNVFSQNKSDSLLHILQTNPPDSQRLAIYLDITWELMYQNPDSAIIYAQKAIDLSEKNNRLFDKANAFNAIGTIYSVKTDYIKSIEYEQKAIEIMQNLLSEQSENQLFMQKLGIFYLNLANAYYHSSLYEKAIENYQNSLLLAEQTNFTNLISNCLTSIGSTYRDMKMYDLSLKYYKKGLEFAEQSGVSFFVSQALNNLGNFYIGKNLDSAEFYYYRAKKILENDENYYYLLPTLINILEIKIKKNQYDSANFYLSKINELLENIEYPEVTIKYYYFLGQYNTYTKNYAQALQNYQTSLNLAKEYNFPTLILDNLQAISNIYILKKDYKNAYFTYLQANAIEDSIYNIEKNKALAEAEIKFEMSKKEMEIQQLKKEKLYNKRILYMLLAILILLIIGAFMGIYLFIQKQKNLRLKHALIEKEKVRLDEESNFKSRQLTTQALIMIQKNKTMSSILKDLTQIAKKADDELKKEINLLKRKLKRNIKNEDDWDLFRHYFEDVNPDFFTKVLKINDKISKSELKLCALIKLRFSIKESAEILNLSPDSVKTARYQLRKKLNLSKGQDISDFLNNL